MYKAIISDLDGTLLNSHHHLSERTCDTIRQLVDQGVHFILATGRHLINVRNIRDELGVRCDLVTANGAVVSDPDDRIIHESMLPHDIAVALTLTIPARFPDVDVNVYTDTGWHVTRDRADAEKYRRTGIVYQITDFQLLINESLQKVFYQGAHAALLKLEKHLQSIYADQLTIAFSTDDCLEVMAKDVHKGNAVLRALASHGIAPEDAIAFGDGMNDYEMLTMVGTGIVMHNAIARLHQSLPDLPRAPSCDDDGVARYLEGVFGV